MRSDVLLASESGGTATMLTRDGLGIEPSLDWPRVAYQRAPHFTNKASTLLVRDLRSGRRWSVPFEREEDYAHVGGALIVSRALDEGGGFGLANPFTGQHVLLHQPEQVTLHGYYIGQIAPGNGEAVGIGRDEQTQGKYYALAIFRLHNANPLDDILAC